MSAGRLHAHGSGLGRSIAPLMLMLMLMLMVMLATSSMSFAQGSALGQTSVQVPDPGIVAALRQVSAARVQADIDKLVSFGTRSTLSAQDDGSIAAGEGIGAAREWIKSQFLNFAQACGGCLEVMTDSYSQEPGERIPKPTQITSVYAVQKGTDPEAAKRIVTRDRPL